MRTGRMLLTVGLVRDLTRLVQSVQPDSILQRGQLRASGLAPSFGPAPLVGVLWRRDVQLRSGGNRGAQ